MSPKVESIFDIPNDDESIFDYFCHMDRQVSPEDAFRHFFQTWYQENKASLSRSEQQNIWAMHKSLGVPKRSPSLDWIKMTLERYAPERYEFQTSVIIHAE